MPNNITITEITSPSKFWEVSYNVDSAGAKTANLMTSGTFLDRNIGIKITTPSVNGSIGGTAINGSTTANITNVNNINTITNITGKTAGTDYWAIKATATGTSGSYTPKYTVSSAGWLASTVNGAAQTVNVTSDTTGQLLYIPKATYGGSNGNITITTGGYLPQGEVVASMNAVTPTTSYSTNNGWSTYFNSATSTDYHISITPKYSNSAGYVSAHTDTNNGGTGYWKIKTTSLSKGNGSLTLTPGNGNVTLTVGAGDSVSDTNKSMTMATAVPSSGVYYTLTAVGKGTVSGEGKGTISVGTGWISSGSLTSNSATDSKTSNEATTRGFIMKSVNGSSQTGAPPADNTLTSGSFQKIQLQPNSYVKLPAGYNPYDRYIWVASAGSSDVTQASNFNLTVSNTSGISGASAVTIGAKSGTTYPVTANNLQVTATLTANTAGWFSTGSATDTDVDSVTIGTINEAGITYSGGGLSNTANYTGTPTITLATNSSTNMINYRLGTQDTTNYPYYFQIKATTAKLTGTTTVTRADYKDTRTAGYLPARSSTTVLSSTTSSPSVTVNAATNTTYYFSMKKATMTVAGTNTVSPTASVAGTSATLVTKNNSGISVTATGGGTASVTATATTNTAGYAPANTQLGSATLSATNKTTTATQYLKEVEIIKPSSGTREFGIKVPNGNSTITFVFHVDSSGNVTVDNEYSLTY